MLPGRPARSPSFSLRPRCCTTNSRERFGVGVQGIGIGERAYQQALAFAKERVQGRDAVSGAAGQPIICHPDVKRMLLTMRARIMAMRALALTAAGWFDLARHAPDRAAADKARRYVDLLMPGFLTQRRMVASMMLSPILGMMSSTCAIMRFISVSIWLFDSGAKLWFFV